MRWQQQVQVVVKGLRSLTANVVPAVRPYADAPRSAGLAQARSARSPSLQRHPAALPPTARTAVRDTRLDRVGVRDWFDRQTYSGDDFSRPMLAACKANEGIGVSVVLPARNEAATVEAVVAAVAELRGDLVDEIVVVDDGSTDDTAWLAARAGAAVHSASDLLPAHGPTAGKGDVLWRSLTATTGDIVIFVDADIHNPGPHFVTHLLGPLLVNPQVQLVKAFYQRPVQTGEVLYPAGGGRVTELLARPLLNLLWPELAGLVQPLAGEYAGRRTLLERLPFFTGYGVELGLLVDTLNAAGLDAIAQVDVGKRVHHNQPLDALSRMAYAISQVAWHRLEQHSAGATGLLPARQYVQFARDEDGLTPQTWRVPVIERPPHRPAAWAV